MLLKINGYPISTRFGEIDPVHPMPHKGIDFAIPYGTPVEAVGGGTVTALTDEGDKSFGKAVHLHLDNGTDVIYGHLSAFNVRTGQHVSAGEIVGLVGSTGDSTGPHLHLQAMIGGRVIDPSPLVFAASPLEKLNPLHGLEEQLQRTNDQIESFKYWINPEHWFQHLGTWWAHFIQSHAIDFTVMAICAGGFMLWMIGVNAHKKYVFWTFIVYLAVRGFFS